MSPGRLYPSVIGEPQWGQKISFRLLLTGEPQPGQIPVCPAKHPGISTRIVPSGGPQTSYISMAVKPSRGQP